MSSSLSPGKKESAWRTLIFPISTTLPGSSRASPGLESAGLLQVSSIHNIHGRAQTFFLGFIQNINIVCPRITKIKDHERGRWNHKIFSLRLVERECQMEIDFILDSEKDYFNESVCGL
jgi:hypothetical protein